MGIPFAYAIQLPHPQCLDATPLHNQVEPTREPRLWGLLPPPLLEDRSFIL